MTATDDTKKKKEAIANWTEANKKALIDILSTHSGGRYNHLLSDKKKWLLIVKDFHEATGKSH